MLSELQLIVTSLDAVRTINDLHSLLEHSLDKLRCLVRFLVQDYNNEHMTQKSSYGVHKFKIGHRGIVVVSSRF